ncbi:MAG: PAS domain-containing protein [Rhodospirillales bacterium]|nr:PAS domain-containing protein [Rhodospirillales bacterium]
MASQKTKQDVRQEWLGMTKEELVDHILSLENEISLFQEAEAIAHIGHWKWDLLNERMVSCSEEYAQILGRTVDEVLILESSLEGDISDIHPDDVDKYLKAIDLFENSADKKQFNLEFRIMAKDGSYKIVHERADLIHDENGEPISSYGILRDITERKKIQTALEDSENQLKLQVAELNDQKARLEVQASEMTELAEDISYAHNELEKLNSQKDKFFAIIAHDLKSPFNALLGFSQMPSTQAAVLSRDQITEYGSLVYRSADQAYKLL